MAAFEYKALDNKGRSKSGVMEGDSARQVRQLLREQGLTPLEVNETPEKAKREANRVVLFRRGASTSELAWPPSAAARSPTVQAWPACSYQTASPTSGNTRSPAAQISPPSPWATA